MNVPLDVFLEAVTASDIPRLVAVHAAAFTTDQVSNLMLLGRDKGAHDNVMERPIKAWLQDPRYSLTKAIDAATGDIIGWSCWGRKDSSTPSPASTEQSITTQTQTTPPLTTTAPTTSAVNHTSLPAIDGDFESRRRQFSIILRAGTLGYEAVFMGKENYTVLQALVTCPGYQRRGVASALLRAGTAEADAAGVPCWIHASPAAYELYKKAGFEEVGKTDWELDEWAPGGKGGNRGWGRYTFRYMVRPAKKAT